MSTESATDALSVGQVQRRAKNALAREFRGQVWVVGEIKNLREQRGNWYLTLVEPGDYADGTDITLDVACWPKRRLVIAEQLRRAGVTLAAGMQVRVAGLLTLSKFGKVQLEMTALDTEALLGRAAAEKRRLYEALEREGLLRANASLAEPLVPLRIGLVSSEGSEGYNDFLGQLERSPYAFSVAFAHSPVQGPTAAPSLARAIASFEKESVDLVALVRGGGGELDAFDKEAVARAIAVCPVPVWTGIGHTGDHAVSDDIAARSFITPTECGAGIVRMLDAFVEQIRGCLVTLRRVCEGRLQLAGSGVDASRRSLLTRVTSVVDTAASRNHFIADRLCRSAQRDVLLAGSTLRSVNVALRRSLQAAVDGAEAHLVTQTVSLRDSTGRALQRASQDLRVHRAEVNALDPKRPLARGYSLTHTARGSLVTSSTQVNDGDVLHTTVASGSLTSIVTEDQAGQPDERGSEETQ